MTGLAVTRVAAHPGGGSEVTARLRFTNGIPIAEAELLQCLSIAGAPGARIARRPVEAAYTLLLVDPGNGPRSDNVRSLVDAFLERRPDSEAIAIYRWGSEVTQIAPFHTDRRLLRELLAAGLAPSMTTLPAGDALGAAAAALSQAGGPATDALRTVVLVSPRSGALAGLAAGLAQAQPHLVAWLGGGGGDAGQAAAIPAGLRFSIGAQTVPALAVSALAARLDAYKRHAHYAVGVCGPPAPIELRFRDGETTMLSLPARLPEERAGACQPQAIADGQRGFPPRLELAFTPEQRAAADRAFADRTRRPPFELSIRVGPDAPPTRATGRYRGDASYACARRSYSIELDGEVPRFLFRGSAARRFELVSMCRDRMYLRTFTVLRMLASEGLYPIPFDLIEVSVEGVSQGPYLILENPADSLQVHSSRLSSVVRRSQGPGGAGTVPEVRWSAAGDEGARASYEEILASAAGLDGRRLETALATRFDLQGYLTWVGLMNLVRSGGYGDEILFYAAETTAADGARADYHLMTGWDEDDAFTGCRAGGQAIVDPRGLVTCAETELDRRIFADSLLYVRYVSVLGAVIERHPTERFAASAREAAARVLAFLEKPEARAGLAELRALDPAAATSFEAARGLLESELALLVAEYDDSWSQLSERLARFRAER